MPAAYQYLLYRLKGAEILLRVEGDTLKTTGNKGALTPDMQDALRGAKTGLMHAFHKRTDFLKDEIGMQADAADVQAVAEVFTPDEVMCESDRSTQDFRDAMSDRIDSKEGYGDHRTR